jgi:hypothetical protein
MEDCLCGENYQNSKCPSCDIIYCKKSTNDCKFGKNVNEKGHSLCRFKSSYCRYCDKYYCGTHWKKCGCCHYIGYVQCEACRDSCDICKVDLHKSCTHYCEDCDKKICLNCSGKDDMAGGHIGPMIYWCKECSKKYPDYIEGN